MKTILLLVSCLFLTVSAEEPAHPLPPADAALSQGSLYTLESVWTDQNGKRVVWSESNGTPRVVALGYATCKGICPRLIADMQRIEKEIDPASKVRFTFITLDPGNDKEPEMQALAKNHQLDPSRWDLLIGDDEAVIEIAVALGIRYNRLPNEIDFAHSYLVAVIGPDGILLHKWTDPKAGPEDSIRALRK
jgi:protein SCO1